MIDAQGFKELLILYTLCGRDATFELNHANSMFCILLEWSFHHAHEDRYDVEMHDSCKNSIDQLLMKAKPLLYLIIASITCCLPIMLYG